MPRRDRLCVLSLLLISMAVAISVVADDVDAEPRLDLMLKEPPPTFLLQYNFSLRHLNATSVDTIVVKVLDEPAGWVHFLVARTNHGVHTSTVNTSFVMDVDENADLTVTIYPHDRALNGSYCMAIHAYIQGRPDINDTYRFCVVVPQFADCSVELFNPPPGYGFRAIPPSTITMRYALSNRGNGQDRFHVTVDISPKYARWDPEIVSGVNEFGWTPDLQADPNGSYSHFIDVKLPIPAGEVANRTVQVWLNVTSGFNSSKQWRSPVTNVTSMQYYNFQVFIEGPDRKEGIPGSEVHFSIRINNMGNGIDAFSLRPVWEKDMNPGFNASVHPRKIALDRHENGTVVVNITVPERAPKKTYFFVVEVGSSSPELSPVPKSVAVEVGQFFSVSLSTEVDTMATSMGGIVDFVVTLRNEGNGLDSVTIEMTDPPTGWLHYITPPEASLLQDQEATIRIRVITSTRPAETPGGANALTLRAESARSDAFDELELVVEVDLLRRIEVAYEGHVLTSETQSTGVGPDVLINPSSPGERSWTTDLISIVNEGNVDASVYVEVTADTPMLSVDVQATMGIVAYGSSLPLTLNIAPTAGILPGTYHVSVRTGCLECPDETNRTIAFVVRVFEANFELVGLQLGTVPVEQTDDWSYEVAMDTAIWVSLDVEFKRPGTLYEVDILVFVTKPDAERGLLKVVTDDTALVGEVGQLGVWWTADTLGDHHFEVEARIAGVNGTHELLTQFNITVKDKGTQQRDDPDDSSGLEGPLVITAISAAVLVLIRTKSRRSGPRKPIIRQRL